LNAPEFLLVVISEADDVFIEHTLSTLVGLDLYDNSGLPGPPAPNDIPDSNHLPLFTWSAECRLK
jgi:hypothetical protein